MRHGRCAASFLGALALLALAGCGEPRLPDEPRLAGNERGELDGVWHRSDGFSYEELDVAGPRVAYEGGGCTGRSHLVTPAIYADGLLRLRIEDGSIVAYRLHRVGDQRWLVSTTQEMNAEEVDAARSRGEAEYLLALAHRGLKHGDPAAAVTAALATPFDGLEDAVMALAFARPAHVRQVADAIAAERDDQRRYALITGLCGHLYIPGSPFGATDAELAVQAEVIRIVHGLAVDAASPADRAVARNALRELSPDPEPEPEPEVEPTADLEPETAVPVEP